MQLGTVQLYCIVLKSFAAVQLGRCRCGDCGGGWWNGECGMIRLEEKVWDRMMGNIVGVGDWIGGDGGQSGGRITADANC